MDTEAPAPLQAVPMDTAGIIKTLEAIQSSRSATSPAKKIHRSRFSYSCHSCRARKVKCDKVHPICTNCSKSNTECIYNDNSKLANEDAGKRKRPRRAQMSDDDTRSQSAYDDGGTFGMAGPYRGESPSRGPEGHPASYLQPGDLEQRMGKLADIVGRFYQSSVTGGPPMRPEDMNEIMAFKDGGKFPWGSTQSVAPTKPDGARSGFHPSQRKSSGDDYGRRERSATSERSSDEGYRSGPAVSQIVNDVLSHLGSNESPQSAADSSGPTTPSDRSMMPRTKEASENDNSDPLFEAPDELGLGLGHLSIQDGGRSRYVGSTFWAYVSNEISELNLLLNAHSQPEITDRAQTVPNYVETAATEDDFNKRPDFVKFRPELTDQEARLAQIEDLEEDEDVSVPTNFLDMSKVKPKALRATRTFAELLETRPSRQICDALVESFLDNVHPIFPLVHEPTFRKNYEDFWQQYPAGQGPKQDKVPPFVGLVFAVLYGGALSAPLEVLKAKAQGFSRSCICSQLYYSTTRALALSGFPRSPSTDSLTAFLIVQTCLIREEDPLTSSSFIGMAMRVAQSMGYHRDGSLFKLPPVEVEVRRRIWWHILFLDVNSAVATGLPPLAGGAEDQYDVEMPSELRDEYIGVVNNSELDPKASAGDDLRLSTAMIAAIGRFKAMLTLRQLVSKLFGVRKPMKKDIAVLGDMIFKLRAGLESRISRIPARGIPELSIFPPGSNRVGENPKEVVFNNWARVMLSLLADKAFSVLYQPFMKSTRSNLWIQARQCALHSCRSYLRKYVYISTAPAFQPYFWYCPGTLQPLHPTIILLLDLFERPFSQEAALARKYLDDVFLIFGREAGVVDDRGGQRWPAIIYSGGEREWDMLSGLREKAYARGGVDVRDARKKAREVAKGRCTEARGEQVVDVLSNPKDDQSPHMKEDQQPMQQTPPEAEGESNDAWQEMMLSNEPINPFPPAPSPGDSNTYLMAAPSPSGYNQTLGWAGMPMLAPGLAGTATDDYNHQQQPSYQMPQQMSTPVDAEILPDVGDFDWQEWDNIFGKYVF